MALGVWKIDGARRRNIDRAVRATSEDLLQDQRCRLACHTPSITNSHQHPRIHTTFSFSKKWNFKLQLEIGNIVEVEQWFAFQAAAWNLNQFWNRKVYELWSRSLNIQARFQIKTRWSVVLQLSISMIVHFDPSLRFRVAARSSIFWNSRICFRFELHFEIPHSLSLGTDWISRSWLDIRIHFKSSDVWKFEPELNSSTIPHVVKLSKIIILSFSTDVWSRNLKFHNFFTFNMIGISNCNLKFQAFSELRSAGNFKSKFPISINIQSEARLNFRDAALKFHRCSVC